MTALPDAFPLSSPVRDASRIGRRRFLVGAGAVAGASAVGTLGLPSSVHAAVPGGASNFHILAKAYRAADTRAPGSYDYEVVDPGRHIRVEIAGVPHPDSTPGNPIAGVPADATAVVVNVTGIKNGGPNNIRVFPTGPSIPGVSNVNVAPSSTSANMATVKLGGSSVDVLAHFPTDMVLDVLGYYRPVTGSVKEGRYVGLQAPMRAFDQSVPAQQYTTVDVTDEVPADASSAVINLTAVQVSGVGWYAAMPHDASERPTTSNLNVSHPGETRAGAAVVPIVTVGGRRRIKVFAVPSAARLIVDVFGYYTGPASPGSTEGLFVPMDPVRIRDTRADGDPLGRLWPHWVVEQQLPSEIRSQAAAVVMNVTAVNPRSERGHLRVMAAQRAVPGTSTLNWVGPYAVPNHVISSVTESAGVAAYTPNGCHVLFDLAGYFTGASLAVQPGAYSNPPPPPAPPEWTLKVPGIGLVSRVVGGESWVVDLGHSWHWKGTGYMGQDADVALFAHRTSAGGPYRHLDQLGPGSTATIVTSDRREYNYRYVGRTITDANPDNIKNASRRYRQTEDGTRTSPPTISLIACTVGYDSSKSAYPNFWAPTSLKYRILVTFELESWREL